MRAEPGGTDSAAGSRRLNRRARNARWLIALFGLVLMGALALSSRSSSATSYPSTFVLGPIDLADTSSPIVNVNSLSYDNTRTALQDAADDDPTGRVQVPMPHLGEETITIEDAEVEFGDSGIPDDPRDGQYFLTIRGFSTDTSTLLTGVPTEVLVIVGWDAATGVPASAISTTLKAVPDLDFVTLGEALGGAIDGVVGGVEVNPFAVSIGVGDSVASLQAAGDTDGVNGHLALPANLSELTTEFLYGDQGSGTYDEPPLYADVPPAGSKNPVPLLASLEEQTRVAASVPMSQFGDLVNGALGFSGTAPVTLEGGLGYQFFSEKDQWDPKVTEWSLNATLPSSGLPYGLDGIFQTDSTLQWALGMRWEADEPDGGDDGSSGGSDSGSGGSDSGSGGSGGGSDGGSGGSDIGSGGSGGGSDSGSGGSGGGSDGPSGGSSGTGSTPPSGKFVFTATATLRSDFFTDSDDLNYIETTLRISATPKKGEFDVKLAAVLADEDGASGGDDVGCVWDEPFGIDWLPCLKEVKIEGGIAGVDHDDDDSTKARVEFSGKLVGTINLFDDVDLALTVGGKFASDAFKVNVRVELKNDVSLLQLADFVTGGADFVDAIPAQLSSLTLKKSVIDVEVARAPTGDDGGSAPTTEPSTETTTAGTQPEEPAPASTEAAPDPSTTQAATTTDATTTTSPGDDAQPGKKKYKYTFKVVATTGVGFDLWGNGQLISVDLFLIVDTKGVTVGIKPGGEIKLSTLLPPHCDDTGDVQPCMEEAVPAALDFVLASDSGGGFGAFFSTAPRFGKDDPLTAYPASVRSFVRPLYGIAATDPIPISSVCPGDNTSCAEIRGGVAVVATFVLPTGVAAVMEKLGVNSQVTMTGSLGLFGETGTLDATVSLKFASGGQVCVATSNSDPEVEDPADTRPTADPLDPATVPRSITETTLAPADCTNRAPATIDFLDKVQLSLNVGFDPTKLKLAATLRGEISLRIPAGVPSVGGRDIGQDLRNLGVGIESWDNLAVDANGHVTEACPAGSEPFSFAGYIDRDSYRCYDIITLGVDAALEGATETVKVDLGAEVVPKVVDGEQFFYPFGLEWLGVGKMRVELGLTYSGGSAGSVGVRAGFTANAAINLPTPSGEKLSKDLMVAGSFRLQSTTTPIPVVTVVPEGLAFSTESGLGLADLRILLNSFLRTIDPNQQLIPNVFDQIPDLEIRNASISLGLVSDLDTLCIPFGFTMTGDLYYGNGYTGRGLDCNGSTSVPEGADASFCEKERTDNDHDCLASMTLKVTNDGIFGEVFRSGVNLANVVKFDDMRFALGLSPTQQFVSIDGGAELAIPSIAGQSRIELFDAELHARLGLTQWSFYGVAELVNGTVRGLVDGKASINPFDDPATLDFTLALSADVDGLLAGSKLQEKLLQPIADVLKTPLLLSKALLEVNKEWERTGSISGLMKNLPDAFKEAGAPLPPELKTIHDRFEIFLDLIDPFDKYVKRTTDKFLNGLKVKSVVPKPFRKFVPDKWLDTRIPGACQIFGWADKYPGFRKDPKGGERRDHLCERKKILMGFVVPVIDDFVQDYLDVDLTLSQLIRKIEALDLNTLPFDDLCLVVDLHLAPLTLLTKSDNGEPVDYFRTRAGGKFYGEPIYIDFLLNFRDFLEFDVGKPKAAFKLASELLTNIGVTSDGSLSEYCSPTPEQIAIITPEPPRVPVLTSLTIEKDGGTETDPIREGDSVRITGSFDLPLTSPRDLYVEWGFDINGDGVVDEGDAQWEKIPADPEPVLPDGSSAPPTTFSFTTPYLDDNPTGTPADSFTVRITDMTGGLDLSDQWVARSATTVGENIAPTISLSRVGSGGPIVEGDEAEFEISIDDVGSLDTHEVVVDWGDGQQDIYEAQAPSTFRVAHRWLDDRPTGVATADATVTARVTDDDTGSDAASVDVTVINRDPWGFSVSKPVRVESSDGTPIPEGERGAATTELVEGDLYEFDVRFTDVAADAHVLTVEWSDGTTTKLPDPSPPCPAVVDPENLPDGDLDDPDEDVGPDFPCLVIESIASVEVPAGDLDFLEKLEQVTVVEEATTVPDLSYLDETEVVFLDGAGNPVEVIPPEVDDEGLPTDFEPPEIVYAERTVKIRHRWADDDPTGTNRDKYPVKLSLTDDDTGSVAGTRNVWVNDRAPWDVEISDATRVRSHVGDAPTVGTGLLEGDRYEFEFSFTDVVPDTHAMVVDWGDGSTTTIPDVAAVSDIEWTNGVISDHVVTLTHRWDDENPTGTTSDLYEVSVEIVDDDTLQSATAKEFEVADAVPEIVVQGSITPGALVPERFDLPAPVFDEWGIAVIDAEVADPSRGDSHTVIVDWGDGTDDDVLTFDPVPFDGEPAGFDTNPFADNYVARPFTVEHRYGDNGVFTVTFTVTDDDGLWSQTTTTVTVHNVEPTLELNRDETVDAWPGRIFTTQIGRDNPFDATSEDPGSDDLTFTWDFGDGSGDSELHVWRESGDPEPVAPVWSPEFNPVIVTDQTSHVYTRACVYELTVDVVDDDGGEGPQDGTSVVVVGLETTRHTTGWWGARYGVQLLEEKEHTYTFDEYSCYLEIAEFMSSMLGEVVDISDYEAAGEVLHAIGGSKRAQLQGEILAAWLNYATGAVGVTGEGKIDLEWMAILYEAEALAMNPSATDQDLRRMHTNVEAAQRRFD